MSTGDWELSIEQLNKIAEFAESEVKRGDEKTFRMAFLLLVVTVCMHKHLLGEPESYYGPELDRWCDETVGQKWRMRWMRVWPVVETLEALGFLD